MSNPPVDTGDHDRDKWHLTPFQWILIGSVVLVLVGVCLLTSTGPAPLAYGAFRQMLEDPHISFRDIQVSPTKIQGTLITADGAAVAFTTSRLGLQNDPELIPLLRQKVGSHFTGQTEEPGVTRFLLALVPPLVLALLMGLVVFWAVRKLSGGMMGMGRGRSGQQASRQSNVCFEHVAGLDEAVEELREIVDFLKTPQKYQALGGRIPKGVLLVGPPGTGKTLLARAVAGEARVPFFSMSGSEFVEMFVGVGAARIRDLFSRAAKCAPSIVFIDELDAIGKTRGGRVHGSHDERDQTLNQLLVELDGFSTDRGVIVMGATNRPEILDPALLRPGRFDRTIVVDRPDICGREAILKVHARGIKLAEGADLRSIASLTPGFAGADLANLMNEAALMAARRGRAEVHPADLEEAVERGAAGLERKRRVMRPSEKKRVAYHESGHAVVACLLPHTDPVHKVSIIPRGLAALGYTMQRPEDDRYLLTRTELIGQIKVLLGGTLAEEMVFDEISTGAQNDLERASRIARSMVKQYGMSRLGRINFEDQNTSPFLNASASALAAGLERGYSEQTARRIDREIARIMDEATTAVRDLLSRHRTQLEAVAQRLMEKEVVEGNELRALLGCDCQLDLKRGAAGMTDG